MGLAGVNFWLLPYLFFFGNSIILPGEKFFLAYQRSSNLSEIVKILFFSVEELFNKFDIYQIDSLFV